MLLFAATNSKIRSEYGSKKTADLVQHIQYLFSEQDQQLLKLTKPERQLPNMSEGI